MTSREYAIENDKLIMKIIKLKKALNKVEEHSLEDDYCYVCNNHPSSGHSPDCVFYKEEEDGK